MNFKNKTGNLHQITFTANVLLTGYTNCDKFCKCIHCIENFKTIHINLQNKTYSQGNYNEPEKNYTTITVYLRFFWQGGYPIKNMWKHLAYTIIFKLLSFVV